MDSALIDCSIKFEEFLSLAITNFGQKGERLNLLCIYRRPNSTSDNNEKLLQLISYFCGLDSCKLVILGDFNLPDIDWTDQSAESKYSNDLLNSLNDNFLIQKVDSATRARGRDKQHILDLVISNDEFISKIEYLSPLGCSDHAVLNIFLDKCIDNKINPSNLNFKKGDYNRLRQYLDIDWDDRIGNDAHDVESMYQLFTEHLSEGIRKSVPMVRTFHQSLLYRRPLPIEIRENIKLKHRLWKKYVKTKNDCDFNNF